MGKTESQFWSDVVRPALLPHGIVKRVENVLDEGTPDVSYSLLGVGGWLELKSLTEWPARPETPVAIRHYTPAQRKWHADWCQAGGRCFVLVRVCGHGTTYTDDLELASQRTPDEFFLFRGDHASTRIGEMTRHGWMRECQVWGQQKFPVHEIVSILTGVDLRHVLR